MFGEGNGQRRISRSSQSMIRDHALHLRTGLDFMRQKTTTLLFGTYIVALCVSLSSLLGRRCGEFHIVSSVEAWNDDSPLVWNKENVSKVDIIDAVAQVAWIEPSVQVNDSCTMPPLKETASCTGHDAFTGNRLDAPRKLALMYLISFEADALEISLREAYDVVDYIFLVEATRIHNPKGQDGRGVKPLMWEALRSSERFSFVPREKVYHIIVDDVDIHKATMADENDIWSMEQTQTDVGIQKIRRWAETSNIMKEDDILISADADEVIARDVLHELKWCETAAPVFSGALWMPMGNLNHAFHSDFPAPGLPFTFALTTLYSWKLIASEEERGARISPFEQKPAYGPPKFVAGGTHLTNPSFMPYQILKRLTTTDYDGKESIGNYTLGQLEEEQQLHYTLDSDPEWKERLINITDADQEHQHLLGYVPWFLSCNRDRFPYWYGDSDSRTKALLYVLKQLAAGQQYDMAKYLFNTASFHGNE